jgi:cysteinyl-tRNA synthetase
MNLGDIDDRTIRECLRAGGKLREFTERWERVFFESLSVLRVQRAHHYPRASEHVSDMVDQTRRLLEKGFAYEKLRSIYFRISKLPDYGRLSGIKPHQMRTAATTTYDYYDKDHPGDFALFKRSTLAELKAGIFWPTPWGNARPGWHVECSSMAVRYLGQPFDIHTASTDLTFPHGDNEIAIAFGLNDKSLANLWMHSEVVMAEGKKVSRAAGNDITLEHLLERGFDGTTVRYWLLATHYRTVLHYSPEALERAGRCVFRLNEFAGRLRRFTTGPRSPDLDQVLYETQSGWQEALDTDLNIPKAVGKLFAFIRYVNRLLNRGELDSQQVRQVHSFVKQANDVLDVIDFEQVASDAEVAKLIDEREKARQARDFLKADAIREQLNKMGIGVRDASSGTSGTKIPRRSPQR